MWVSDRPGASGGEINFGGAREVYFVWIGEGHEKFIPVWIKSTRWGAKIQRDFSAEIGISSGFSGRKQVISEKKKGLHPKNVMKSGVSRQKTPYWASICTPVAPSLLISSGHSPRLGGTTFVWGGTAPVCPPRGAGLVSGARQRGKRVCLLDFWSHFCTPTCYKA